MTDEKPNTHWKDLLNPYAKFIGTFGLAVFLVLYYTLSIYPSITKEREEWIRQIEELRRSINPDEKNMSYTQAEVILDYVTDLYILNVGSDIPKNKFTSFIPGGGAMGGGFGMSVALGIQDNQMKDTLNYHYFRGNIGTFKMRRQNEYEEQFLQDFFTATRQKIHLNSVMSVREYYDPLFNKALSNASNSSSRLRVFSLNDKSLYEIWNSSLGKIGDLETELKAAFANDFTSMEMQSLNFEVGSKIDMPYITPDTTLYESPEQVLSKYRKILRETWQTQLDSAFNDVKN